jgi:hypothetical protein
LTDLKSMTINVEKFFHYFVKIDVFQVLYSHLEIGRKNKANN